MKYALNQFGKVLLRINILKVNSSLRDVPPGQVESWFNKKRFFFILSLGRSGSMFLADLLNKDENNLVLHEPTRLDFLAYIQAFQGAMTNYDYISEFRKKLIFYRNNLSELSQYGEVNSLLRRHPQTIRQNIPNVKLFHLVRDGRDVVRSMMARWTYTAKDPFANLIRPKPGEKFYNNWPEMNRFEKLCWYWRIENEHLDEMIGNPFHFEKLISDYHYLKENLLDPLELNISQKDWLDKINVPKNSTTKHTIPHWKKWNTERNEQFDYICGDLMKKFDYYGQ